MLRYTLFAIGFMTYSAMPVLAQSDSEGQTSFFEAFLWSDDPLGLFVIWLLLIMSFVSIGLAISFVLKFRRQTLVPEETEQAIQQMIDSKQYREAIEYANSDESYLAKLVSAAMGEASNGYGAMERAIEEQGDVEISRYLRPIEILNVLGNISPMLGLFGTVYGMIVAFQQLVASGGSPDPAELAAGISTALVTTFWGLVVAIPALAAYALVRNKIDALTSEGMVMAEEIISPFKPGAKKKASGGGGSSRGAASPKVE
ncbi:MAG: MotA/TolQ/ExbB proton channel family protein [Phycisphaeraceae bacterium]|nr:MotA/TolQ/ExbB proton channel family protein [Phycisphaeraceae bacterium]